MEYKEIDTAALLIIESGLDYHVKAGAIAGDTARLMIADEVGEIA